MTERRNPGVSSNVVIAHVTEDVVIATNASLNDNELNTGTLLSLCRISADGSRPHPTRWSRMSDRDGRGMNIRLAVFLFYFRAHIASGRTSAIHPRRNG
jgi:hypothetical protein